MTSDKNIKSTVVAKEDDGTIQITFTIAWPDIAKKRESVTSDLVKNVEVPGFRKGKAPIEKAKAKLDPNQVLERTLALILPEMFADAIKEHNIRPAMYPKFELIHAHEGEDWQVRARTAQFPEFKLGDYKKELKGAAASGNIWTPDKGDPKDAKNQELTREQKENIAISSLTKLYTFTIPGILIEEEVNSRLASLLEKIEKLGLSLESYLSSIKKTVEELRNEYSEQAERAIRLDIILGAIAEEEKITVSEDEIKQFIAIANASSPESKLTDDQKSTISSFLIKRKVLDTLASFVS